MAPELDLEMGLAPREQPRAAAAAWAVDQAVHEALRALHGPAAPAEDLPLAGGASVAAPEQEHMQDESGFTLPPLTHAPFYPRPQAPADKGKAVAARIVGFGGGPTKPAAARVRRCSAAGLRRAPRRCADLLRGAFAALAALRASASLFSRLHDLAALGLSVADCVLDLAVLREFHADQMWVHFDLSLVCFALSQCAYTLYFVVQWMRTWSRRQKICGFFLVFPLAQLLPVFAFLEAQHFPRMDRWLRRMGLSLTDKQRPECAASAWNRMLAKWHAHAGFMLEAVVEAVPQSLLQAHAALIRPPSLVDAVSILFSLVVLVSKACWLAFAPDVPTQQFHVACIAFDLFALFGATTWAASPAAHEWTPAIALAAACALAAAVLSAALWLVFGVLDDHLKTLLYAQLGRRHGAAIGYRPRPPAVTVWFDIYLAPALGALAASLPLVVLAATCRLTLLPLRLGTAGLDVQRRSCLWEQLVQWVKPGGADGKLRHWRQLMAVVGGEYANKNRAHCSELHTLLRQGSTTRDGDPRAEFEVDLRAWAAGIRDARAPHDAATNPQGFLSGGKRDHKDVAPADAAQRPAPFRRRQGLFGWLVAKVWNNLSASNLSSEILSMSQDAIEDFDLRVAAALQEAPLEATAAAAAAATAQLARVAAARREALVEAPPGSGAEPAAGPPSLEAFCLGQAQSSIRLLQYREQQLVLAPATYQDLFPPPRPAPGKLVGALQRWQTKCRALYALGAAVGVVTGFSLLVAAALAPALAVAGPLVLALNAPRCACEGAPALPCVLTFAALLALLGVALRLCDARRLAAVEQVLAHAVPANPGRVVQSLLQYPVLVDEAKRRLAEEEWLEAKLRTNLAREVLSFLYARPMH